MKNALTFDVEDWYQSTFNKSASIREIVIEQTSKVLDILSQANVHSTFFIQGLVAEAFPQVVREIHTNGHEIGTHGYSHEFVFNQTPSAFEEDLKKSIELLENITGNKIIGYRAPDFSITYRSLWALDILEKSGIIYDSSIFPIKNSRYGIPNFRRSFHYVKYNGGLIEFPLSTVRIFGVNFPASGGGYFRLLPYTIIKSAISKINAEGMPVIVYMHPYEFDPYDLTKPLAENEDLSTKLFKFKQNMNRSKSETKLKCLLRDFTFTTVAEVLNIDK